MAQVVPRATTKTQFVTPGELTLTAREIIEDYRLAFRSRVASIIGRREVLTGKAGFGIFGDGKEIPQLAMAKVFRAGDWRAGYYRDQTFMFAAGILTFEEFFAQLYANSDVRAEPHSVGRQMVNHFATRLLDDDGRWRPQAGAKNSSADISGVGAQMARALGLAYASKLYRLNADLRAVAADFSRNGDEVCFATIGDAGTSEGVFWETLNAAAVLQVPLAISVWDDGYGISVPRELQTAKDSISRAAAGFQGDGGPGVEIHVVRAHDYVACCDTYAKAIERVRREHVPALIHVIECTQPQGHSTSGSHERYKSKARLAWEEEYDGIRRMRAWMLAEGLATAEQLDRYESDDRREVEARREAAWEAYQAPIRRDHERATALLGRAARETGVARIGEIVAQLRDLPAPLRRDVHAALARAAAALRGTTAAVKEELDALLLEHDRESRERYTAFLYSRSTESPLRVREVKPAYSATSPVVDGRVVLVRCFDANLARDQRIFIIGEDIGKLGDVNLGLEGMNAKYGDLRVTDTGIRETTILGQGIGAALRGLRPIVEIQYIDYLLFGLQTLADDLATVHWRTAGGQKAPVIVRTRGHRLQGIWHTGSPMSTILGICRGVRLCVPRDMTRAAGFYNTLLRSDDPAIVVEVLNGYRVKERLPDNVGDFTVPLGVPEVIREGRDLTVVTYGALCRVALEAAKDLEQLGVDVEVVDVQTLEPFDREGGIGRSLEKTSAVLFVDEDVPGGASAYMLQQVLEEQGGWQHLDAGPRTLTATASRSPYAQDGDYFTKPNREDIVAAAYAIARERDPRRYPPLVGRE